MSGKLANSVIVDFVYKIKIKAQCRLHIGLLARLYTYFMSVCAILTCIRKDGATCAEIKSGLSGHSFIRGFYAGRDIALNLSIMKGC